MIPLYPAAANKSSFTLSLNAILFPRSFTRGWRIHKQKNIMSAAVKVEKCIVLNCHVYNLYSNLHPKYTVITRTSRLGHPLRPVTKRTASRARIEPSPQYKNAKFLPKPKPTPNHV